MGPWTIASLIATGLSGVMTVVAAIFDQKDRNDEIDKRIDEKMNAMHSNNEESV